MLGLQTAASIFAQLTTEEAFGLVVFDIIIASPPAPAIGLAKFCPTAGRVHRAAELCRIDKGLDHQHRMAVASLPIGRKTLQGQTQDLTGQVGHRAPRQDKEAAIVGNQTEATVPLCRAPSDPFVSMLEVLSRGAEDQQRQPLTLGVGSYIVQALAYFFGASQIVMLIEQLSEILQFSPFHEPYLDLI